MNANETSKEMQDLIEVAALRIAQTGIATKSEFAGLVRTLRRTFPEWLYVHQERAVNALVERFEDQIREARRLAAEPSEAELRERKYQSDVEWNDRQARL